MRGLKASRRGWLGNLKGDGGHQRGERTGRKSEGRREWLASLSLSLLLSRGVERYSFRGGGRLDEAVVVAEEEDVEEEEDEVEEDGVRPINHGIIIESVISKAC